MDQNNYYFRIFIEAIIVGILTVIVGYFSSSAISNFEKSDLPKICETWNKNYVMEKTLFLTGFLVHIMCETVGINKWYCKNGTACLAN